MRQLSSRVYIAAFSTALIRIASEIQRSGTLRPLCGNISQDDSNLVPTSSRSTSKPSSMIDLCTQSSP